jgi:N6-L-threonylcarbamoyladenine synthase
VISLESLGDLRASPKVLSNVVASQNDLHGRFGGVVPELASRRHVEMIEPVLRAALEDAGVSLDGIGAVAVTRGPGLVIALLVGLSAAKAIAWSRGIPLVGVHHLAGHIYSLFLENPENGENAGATGGPPPFPHLALVVSGGHTDFYRVEAPGREAHLGGTLDDAVGEAYDKVAASMGLGYPGGPVVDRLHAEFHAKARPGEEPILLPRPYLEDKLYSFSFSGLKTAVMSYLRERGLYRDDPGLAPWARAGGIADEEARALAAGFQEAAVDVLTEKVDRVVRAQKIKAVSVSGGVASNRHLRDCLARRAQASGWSLHLPARRYCTDNAAMIACAGAFALQAGEEAAWMDYLALDADPAWELGSPGGAAPAARR